MALGKDHMGYVQVCADNGNLMGDFPSLGTNGFGDSSSEKTSGVLLTRNLATSQSSSSLGNPSSANSNEFVFQATSNRAEEAQPLINFNRGCNSLVQANGSLPSSQPKNRAPQSIHKDCYSTWEYEFSYNNQMNPKCSTDPRLLENLNYLRTACNANSMSDPEREIPGDWLYHEGTALPDNIQKPERHDTSFHKRPSTGESMQAPQKKQCNSNASATRKSKPKLSATPKEPQSAAAKIRRERISEKLKILQELVPNGSKVDLVTMLEKAISYVKFLQLQVKVLATDEFWPAQGGTAPDISEVKEAIDAILSSQRDRNSSSSSK